MPRGRPRGTVSIDFSGKLSADRPKGEQIREHLEGLARQAGPGSPMPSDRQLAELFGVARMTVRNEITQLASEGILDAQPGRGTFVQASPRTAYEVGASYTLSTSAGSKTPGARLLTQSATQASDSLAAWLQIEPGSQAVIIERLRTTDGEPVGIERVALPLDRFPGLETVNLENDSLYRVLEERWNLRRVNLEARAAAVLPSSEDATLLGITESTPCVALQMTNRDENRAIFEVGNAIYRGDRYELLLHHDARMTTWRS